MLTTSTVFALPQASGRALVAAALEHFRKEAEKDEDYVEDSDENEPTKAEEVVVYKLTLPRFQTGTSKLLEGISRRCV
jgi:hypothetical protein